MTPVANPGASGPSFRKTFPAGWYKARIEGVSQEGSAERPYARVRARVIEGSHRNLHLWFNMFQSDTDAGRWEQLGRACGVSEPFDYGDAGNVRSLFEGCDVLLRVEPGLTRGGKPVPDVRWFEAPELPAGAPADDEELED